MFAQEESIHIDASAEAVYDYVSDIGRHPEWAAQKLVMRRLGDGRFESQMTMGGIKARAVIHVEAAERATKFAYVADDNVSGPHRWIFLVKPDETGSKLTFRMERMHDAIWARILQPLVMWPLVGHPGILKGLAAIKHNVEGAQKQPSPAPSAS